MELVQSQSGKLKSPKRKFGADDASLDLLDMVDLMQVILSQSSKSHCFEGTLDAVDLIPRSCKANRSS
jgi:hypothetical protein